MLREAVDDGVDSFLQDGLCPYIRHLITHKGPVVGVVRLHGLLGYSIRGRADLGLPWHGPRGVPGRHTRGGSRYVTRFMLVNNT